MFRMALEYVEPGMELGRDIYGADGKVILVAGVTLTAKHIAILKKWEVISIYITSPLAGFLPVKEVVAEATRQRANAVIKKTFEDVTKRGLFELTDEQREIVKAVIRQLLDNRLSIIHLAQIQHHRDDLFFHSINVAILSLMTALSLGITSGDELETLSLGALLHDLGMIAVPQKILAKREPLTEEEKEILEGHTACGFEILRKAEGVSLLTAHVALQHHERYDGKGYPRRIAGESIGRFARIVALADEYDKLVAERPGKESLPPHLAYEKIVAGVGTVFDPVVAKAFLSKIALYPIGTFVSLTTGDIGIVTGVTPQLQHRPIVKVIADEKGMVLQNPYSLDLADKETLTIFVQGVVNDSVAVQLLRKARTEIK